MNEFLVIQIKKVFLLTNLINKKRLESFRTPAPVMKYLIYSTTIFLVATLSPAIILKK